MDITIALAGMPFGPETPKIKSLGGSETAALALARELRKREHSVTVFCLLPDPSQPDHWQSGQIAEDGVRYVNLDAFQQHTLSSETDLSIIVRSPELAAMASIARKKVLWMHDVGTKRGMGRAFDAMQWCVDEVWTVSEWHRQQVHKSTGYPLEFIVPLRNGILKHDVVDMPRNEKVILYAARPERGLDNLIKPNGVMDNLPEYTLKVAMYEHFPEHMRSYYEQVFARMKQMPNVEYIGGKSNAELRQIIRESAAYIYPTQFAETSCILARECIEQGTPFFTTKEGALPETLGDCAVFFEDYLKELGYTEPEKGSIAWCKLFAQFFREGMAFDQVVQGIKTNMSVREDLYWDGVADMVEARFPSNEGKSRFSVAWSMVQDGDVIAAKSYLEQTFNPTKQSWFERELTTEIATMYPFLLNENDPRYQTLGDYYDAIYTGKEHTQLSELQFRDDLTEGSRVQTIIRQLEDLPPGQNIVEFGCGPGHVLAGLARIFPQHDFTGIEISKAAVDCLNKGAAEKGYTNLRAVCGDDRKAKRMAKTERFDVAICSEVLEHVPEPWKTAEVVEGLVRPGGKVIFTVPFGPWEPLTLNQPGKWNERAHIWLLDRKALRQMFQDKPDKSLLGIVNQQPGVNHGRITGNYVASFTADHKPVGKIDVKNKWKTHNTRQTVAGCMIAYNNEDTILRALESIKEQVQIIQIAHGPSDDKTRQIIDEFAEAHPYIRVNVIDVPKIEPYKFGFDDARNASTQGLENVVDWILWIDTDEYLSGDFTQFLRPNCLDAYVIPQHHFTVEPRGAPLQIDRPARLFRTGRGFCSKGHIHEHFELPSGGPGRIYELPRVDIGHTGYVDEVVRQARFHRNFEFLKWDNDEPEKRKLHSFLWFRDMIHWMRLYAREGRPDMAQEVAEAAISYYNENWEAMSTFGPGFAMSQQYITEAYQMVGRGVPMQVVVTFDDRQASIQARFESYEQVERLFKFLVEPELKDRTDRYY